MGRPLLLEWSPAPAVVPILKEQLNRWDRINKSTVWKDHTFNLLATLYGFLAVVALVRLIRIHLRIPESGWTIQKVFHLLIISLNVVRCLVFVFRRLVQHLHPENLQHLLLDLPSLLFFTTYAILALFWADVYYQANSRSTEKLRPGFYIINGAVYVVQIILWLMVSRNPNPFSIMLPKMFLAVVSLMAVLGFLVYGGRLFLMLRCVPAGSMGRRQKLREVGYLTAICASCFLVRCIMMWFDAFGVIADVEVLNHPVLNFVYYFLVEILPCWLVLFVLRKLPSGHRLVQYHPLASGQQQT